MQEAQAAGCHSTAEADRYMERKRKSEAEENGSRKESCQDGGNSRDILNVPVSSDSINTYSNHRMTSQTNIRSLTDSDRMECSEMELLSAPVCISCFCSKSHHSAFCYCIFNEGSV